MSGTLDVAACQHNCRGGCPSHIEFPCLLRLVIKQVQRHTAADSHGAPDVRSIYNETVSEGDITEVAGPKKQGTLRGRSTEEVVARRFDRKLEVMLNPEGDSRLR